METHQEYVHDAILAGAFSVLAMVAGYRTFIYFTLKGSGKVVTLFYALIFTTSFFRAVWFGISSAYLEGSYVPRATVAFHSKYWKGVLVSELLLSIGTISLYAVFILLISFWANMLNKVEENENSPNNIHDSAHKPRGPLETFSFVILSLTIMESINIILYLCRVYNAEVMILYDSTLFTIISLTCLYGITFFSTRIRIILQTLGYINARSTKHQVQRILAVTLAANIFFLLRVIIEVCIGITLVLHFLSNHSFLFVKSDSLWSKFIMSKHWLEVFILSLELIVSTSVSSKPSNTLQTSRPSTTESERKRRNNKPRLDMSSHQGAFLPTAPEVEADNFNNTRGVGKGRISTNNPCTEDTPLLKKKSTGSSYLL